MDVHDVSPQNWTQLKWLNLNTQRQQKCSWGFSAGSLPNTIPTIFEWTLWNSFLSRTDGLLLCGRHTRDEPMWSNSLSPLTPKWMWLLAWVVCVCTCVLVGVFKYVIVIVCNDQMFLTLPRRFYPDVSRNKDRLPWLKSVIFIQSLCIC